MWEIWNVPSLTMLLALDWTQAWQGAEYKYRLSGINNLFVFRVIWPKELTLPYRSYSGTCQHASHSERHVACDKKWTEAPYPFHGSTTLSVPVSCRAHAAPLQCCAVALRSRFQNGMVRARQGFGMGMACVNKTRPHSVNQVGRTQSKPLATRHGRATAAGAQHGRGMVCVN